MKRQMKIDVVSSFQLKRKDFATKSIEGSYSNRPSPPPNPPPVPLFLLVPYIPRQQHKLYRFYTNEVFHICHSETSSACVLRNTEFNSYAHTHHTHARCISIKTRVPTIEKRTSQCRYKIFVLIIDTRGIKCIEFFVYFFFYFICKNLCVSECMRAT